MQQEITRASVIGNDFLLDSAHVALKEALIEAPVAFRAGFRFPHRRFCRICRSRLGYRLRELLLDFGLTLLGNLVVALCGLGERRTSSMMDLRMSRILVRRSRLQGDLVRSAMGPFGLTP